MRAGWLLGVGATIGALGMGCAGGEEVPAPAPPPVAAPSPEPEVAPSPSPAPAGGRKAARSGGGKSLGELHFEGVSLPVTLQGTTLRAGEYSAKLPSAPFQTLVIQAEIPSVVVQYETVEDFGTVDVFTVNERGLVSVYHSIGMSSRITPISGGFEARSGQCGETSVTRVLLGMPRPTEERERHGQRDPNCQVTACPFVDAWVGGRWQTQGEILRNQASVEDAGPQTLPLPEAAISRGRVRVRLAERKPEVTELDAVWLVVDGQEFAPLGCAELALCEEDGAGARIVPGEHLELVFEVGPARGDPTLWASGYYVPLDP
jgi:hypothetical protein